MIFHSQIYVLKYKFKNVNKNKTDKPKLNGSGVQVHNPTIKGVKKSIYI